MAYYNQTLAGFLSAAAPTYPNSESTVGNGTVTSIATGTGLTGGPITTTGTLSIANTAVTLGSYGNATHVGAFTVNQQGQLTAASNVLIAGVAPGGPAGGDLSGTYPNPTVARVDGIAEVYSTDAQGDLLHYVNGQQNVMEINIVNLASTGKSPLELFRFDLSSVGASVVHVTADICGVDKATTPLLSGVITSIHDGTFALTGLNTWSAENDNNVTLYGNFSLIGTTFTWRMLPASASIIQLITSNTLPTNCVFTLRIRMIYAQ